MTYKLSTLALSVCLLGAALAQTPVKKEILNCSISGIVTDPDNRPLSSRIIIYEMRVRDGWRTPFARCSAQTDLDGRFTCGHIPAGHYLVASYSAKPAPGGSVGKVLSSEQAPKQELVYPLTFYPDTTRLDDASIIPLHSGENGWAAMVVRPARARTLSISLPVNTPKSALFVAVQSSDFDLNLREPIQHDLEHGKFVIDAISDGEYLITGNWFAEGADHHGAVVSRVASKSDLNVSIRESAASRITATVHFDTPPGDGMVFTFALYPRTGSSRKSYVSEVAKDGTVKFTAVEPGDYFATLVNGDGWYVRSLSSLGKVYRDGVLSVSGDSPSIAIEAEVSEKAASISGSLQATGTGVGAGVVVFVSLASGEVTTVTADGQGRFGAAGLMPGDYTVLAFPAGSDVPYRSPRILKMCSLHGTNVSVEEGQRLTSIGVRVIEDTGFLPW